MSLTVGSLFAGVGGFDLAAERVGFQVKWQVEIDDYANQVLEKHWPGVRRYRDVRKVHGARGGVTRDWMHPMYECPGCLAAVDVICGGFPCQDVSQAGARFGIGGARSGLWSEYGRIIGELRPRYVVVENVPGLLVRGMDRVLGDLAACGYDAEWQSVPAAAVGAPHIRDRVWILAYPGRELRQAARGERPTAEGRGARRRAHGGRGASVDREEPDGSAGENPALLSDPEGRFQRQLRGERRQESGTTQWHLHWAERMSPVPRVADGVPYRMERNTALGNAIVPQVAEWIFSRIKEAEEAA